ncbi:preprotein translocase subunit SecG [Candidatus Vallotia cooleyia]|uniref:preprotein translocase subunit SecG n=1 Tax=Candidatus Vallotiella adelgis TaxID=1177211 RepID=UPI001D01A2DA|nr:preprotein translocase subunit SecG [Candidatus Vallotia cooleyia]UDG82390.1 Protein-export membrane protein SecG [Candidatus Vallotia cooleyia]
MLFLRTFIIVVQVFSALGVIGLVLMQHGKGADMGTALGSGASGSLFGANGSVNFLSRTTAVFATVFFISTLALSALVNYQPQANDILLDGAPPLAVRDSKTSSGPASGFAAPSLPSPVPELNVPK